MSYENYIAWKRLTHNGQRNRGQMTPEERAEFDQRLIAVERMSSEEAEEAKRLYEEITKD